MLYRMGENGLEAEYPETIAEKVHYGDDSNVKTALDMALTRDKLDELWNAGDLIENDPVSEDATLPASAGMVQAAIARLVPVLLWTNASPTSAYAAQTQSIDLSGYSKVRIEYYNTTSGNELMCSADVPVGGAGALLAIFYSTSTTRLYYGKRSYTVASGGVTFETGYDAAINGSSAITAAAATTGVCIPYKIYGIV